MSKYTRQFKLSAIDFFPATWHWLPFPRAQFQMDPPYYAAGYRLPHPWRGQPVRHAQTLSPEFKLSIA